MKTVLAVIAALLLLATLAEAQVRVDPYTRKDGTYVPGYQRTRPNQTPTDNYSFPGNLNPNTGRITPGNPLRRDSDRDGIPDAYDPKPYSPRSRGSRGLWGR